MENVQSHWQWTEMDREDGSNSICIYVIDTLYINWRNYWSVDINGSDSRRTNAIALHTIRRYKWTNGKLILCFLVVFLNEPDRVDGFIF